MKVIVIIGIVLLAVSVISWVISYPCAKWLAKDPKWLRKFLWKVLCYGSGLLSVGALFVLVGLLDWLMTKHHWFSDNLTSGLVITAVGAFVLGQTGMFLASARNRMTNTLDKAVPKAGDLRTAFNLSKTDIAGARGKRFRAALKRVFDAMPATPKTPAPAPSTPPPATPAPESTT